LRELSNLGSACIDGTNPAQDAVAFALATVFALHSGVNDERAIDGNDAYQLMAMASEYFEEAINFIESGREANDESLRIVSDLARVTPSRLDNRWPEFV
jgi:hypothetical protein